ncbi:MarR family winged helix-turn-helix transcriptional regulator [Acetivibrio cellulolyticus]|uniref:MarR family winged helix-turn-helix transcriptional regulator n=1 Tax=Acetivibrio cellulolyticus TaxID=35830 RepID=UPI0001E2BDA5|nr:MarR family transcriptional regulator [Acetivibrio cellulolyticus]
MSNKNIKDIYNLIQEISWHFGSHGFNGECCGDLSLVEFMALKKIYERENITIQEVGNALNFTKSGASKIIDRIEAKGYISRMTSPDDGRVCCVKVKEKGTEVITGIMERYSTYVDNMLKEFDSEMVQNIKTVLEILVNSAHKQGKV